MNGLSFSTRVINGETEIVRADGQWSFASEEEKQMIARIIELERGLYSAEAALNTAAHAAAAQQVALREASHCAYRIADPNKLQTAG
jgi:hypothetical protein